MLDNMDIFSGTQQAELKAGTLDETGFAQIYFASYPYLDGNTHSRDALRTFIHNLAPVVERAEHWGVDGH